MNKKIKKLWVKALKSGKFKQTKTSLRDSSGYCCLGVLCAVQGASKKDLLFGSYAHELPGMSAGLKKKSQEFLAKKNDLNEKPWSFARIANYVERTY